MTAADVFRVANLVALVGWLLMAVAPRRQVTDWVVHKGLLPLAMSVLYLSILLGSWGQAQGDFGSLAGVKKLFSYDWAVVLGWVHYLAFDMFVGSWILRDSWRREIPHLAMLPILFGTLMFGPVGFLVYSIVARFRPVKDEEEASV